MRVFGWKTLGRNESDRSESRKGGTIDRPSLGSGLSWSIMAETRKMVIYACTG